MGSPPAAASKHSRQNSYRQQPAPAYTLTEDVEAAGASMMARPPSYSQLYHHRGHQDRLDHEDSEGGPQSSLGEPPPYRSGMTLSFSFKVFNNLFSSNSDENINH